MGVLADSPVVLVYLDMASHEASHQSPQHPWDRSLHARLIRRLTAARAKAIVFDILFVDEGPDPASDLELEQAMRESGRVVLAAELSRSTRDTIASPGVVSHGLTLPIDRFLHAAAGTGLANLIVDDDFVVRRYFSRSDLHDLDSLTAEVARRLGLPPLQQPSGGHVVS